MADGFDIIGDVHGQGSKLEDLLKKMGYRFKNGAWRHPSREARFIGDLVDRGSEQLKTLDIVRSMVDAGSAKIVMGNHELNAIALSTKNPNTRTQYMRIRGKKNLEQHQAFLDAVSIDSPLHKEWIEWFKTIPLWMEEDGFRLVHACWEPRHMDILRPFLNGDNTITEELILRGYNKEDPLFDSLEIICKGEIGRAHV